MPVGADVLRQGEAARVEQQLLARGAMASDGREHAHRDVLGVAHPEAGLEQIEEQIDTRPHFRDAGQMPCVQRRGRRTDADDVHAVTCRAQTFGRAHDPGAFVLGDGRDFGDGVGRVGVAGMRHHAREHSRAGQHTADFEQFRGVRQDPRALASGFNFDQDPECGPERAAAFDDRRRDRGFVGHDLQIDAARAQSRNPVELRGRDADRVEDVQETARGEVFGLRQRRDGDRAHSTAMGDARDFGRFGGLQMRPQDHAQFARAFAHALGVAIQTRAVEHQARRRQIGDAHQGFGVPGGGAWARTKASTCQPWNMRMPTFCPNSKARGVSQRLMITRLMSASASIAPSPRIRQSSA